MTVLTPGNRDLPDPQLRRGAGAGAGAGAGRFFVSQTLFLIRLLFARAHCRCLKRPILLLLVILATSREGEQGAREFLCFTHTRDLFISIETKFKQQVRPRLACDWTITVMLGKKRSDCSGELRHIFSSAFLPSRRVTERSSESGYSSRHQIETGGQKHKPWNKASEHVFKKGEGNFQFCLNTFLIRECAFERLRISPFSTGDCTPSPHHTLFQRRGCSRCKQMQISIFKNRWLTVGAL